uniref:Uncharacterized protein n=1 Tax=Lepeophtheirus salmonis TaxID=72036 RepID=A0A0K2UXR7_LEPSM
MSLANSQMIGCTSLYVNLIDNVCSISKYFFEIRKLKKRLVDVSKDRADPDFLDLDQFRSLDVNIRVSFGYLALGSRYENKISWILV